MWTLSQASQAIKDNNWTGLPPQNVEYLVVAGGGGGTYFIGGGGGAGGLRAGFSGVTVGTQLWVTVGSGGAQDANGNASVLLATSSGATTGNIVSTGGGKGGVGYNLTPTNGVSGGSGGGGGSNAGAVTIGGSGISGQGNSGAAGSPSTYGSGGGGGAGTIAVTPPTSGSIGSNGGAGIASAISGTVTVYAGGGGGGGNAVGGSGGAGGGGAGAGGAVIGTAATANTGGGGGGGGFFTDGGAGGSGIVIIRYPDTFNAATSTTGSPTDGQNIIIRWKDAGVSKTLTWDAIFVAIGVTLPASTTAGKWQYVGATYNSGAAKFHVTAVATQA